MSNAVVLNHTISGHGEPTLLLLHPLGAHLGFWDAFVARWRGRLRCVACDLRGSGASLPATAPVTPDSSANDLEALRSHLGLTSVVIVACAVSTMAAATYAARHPGRVAALVLSNPLRRSRPEAARMLRQRAELVRREGMAALLPGAIDNAFVGCADDERRARYAAVFAAQDPEGYAQAALGVAEADATAAFAALRCPVLLITGANDRLLPPDHAEEVRAVLPSAEYALVEDGAHFIPYQKPDAFADLVEGFLARHGLAPREEPA
jgi:3-oxoadipate enol-lactonase